MTAIMPFASHDGGWPRSVKALVLARAVNQLGAFAMSFLAVALVHVYGASLVTAGWVVALFGLATVPSRLAGGRLAGRLGRRATIVLGLLACSAALAVIAVAHGIGGAAAGAVLLGLTFEIYEPPSQALLAEMVAPERRPQAFGLLGAALAAAGAGAGIIAVLVGGVSLRLLFVADSGTCLAAAALVLMWVPEPPATRLGATGSSPWRDVRLLLMLGAGTGFAFAWNLSVTALPLTVAARGLGPAETGWLLAAEAAVTIAGQCLLRDGATRPFFLMAKGLAVVAAGFTVIAFAGSLPLLCLGAAIVALGQVLLLGPAYAVVAGLCDEGSRAGYLAAYGTCWGIAMTLGPLAWTRLLSIGVPVTWLAGTVLCILLAAPLPFIGRTVTASIDLHPSRSRSVLRRPLASSAAGPGHIGGTSARDLPGSDQNCRDLSNRSGSVLVASVQVGAPRHKAWPTGPDLRGHQPDPARSHGKAAPEALAPGFRVVGENLDGLGQLAGNDVL
jgi:MFS family permease